ncbi:MAG: SpoIIE family protein phosphatase [Erysipelotrichaceae bacterium]|nr:SpoIIE family protein phosphatase [Erysipelotrichaceae bacterium]
MSEIHIEAAYKSLNKKGEELCGDHVMIKRNKDSFVMVLADGLGSGVKANILSTLTSTIISEMIYSGCELEEAVETISETLPVCKVRGVAYSTFTIVQVFYNGEANIVEFDNPSTVIIRDKKILEIEEKHKVINGRNLIIRNFICKPNDYIVSFSDGIIHAGIGQVLNLGWSHEEVSKFLITHLRDNDRAKDLTRLLLINVNYLYGGLPGDDSTVACAKVLESKESRVMVGPPSKVEDDEKVVRRLMSASGLKICCGGTTSNIVSRIINKPLEVDDIISIESDVPPKGYIKGLDLVTEGVLTLQKTNRLLSECVKSNDFLDKIEYSDAQDGASLLAKLLLKEASEITFMVGLSDNPAHNSIAYSTISLNAKIQLINEMKKNLEKLGKIVNIEMY